MEIQEKGNEYTQNMDTQTQAIYLCDDRIGLEEYYKNNHLHWVDGALGNDSCERASNETLQDGQGLIITANQAFDLYQSMKRRGCYK